MKILNSYHGTNRTRTTPLFAITELLARRAKSCRSGMRWIVLSSALVFGALALPQARASINPGDPVGSPVYIPLNDAGGEGVTIGGAAMDAMGHAVVTWVVNEISGYCSGAYNCIVAQQIGLDGNPIAAPFQVSATESGSQYFYPSIAMNASGAFVIAWRANVNSNGDLSDALVQAQAFNPDGSLNGPQFSVQEFPGVDPVAARVKLLVA